MGGSGSLLAAVSEKFVFRPSEERAAREKESVAAKIAEDEEKNISIR